MKRLYIYGPPASGKSTLAKRLSQETGLEAVDLDAEIVRIAGRSIPEIFASDGEKTFRDMETKALKSVKAPIVALGGGTLLRSQNRKYAEKHGFVIVLDVDDETIAQRIEAQKGTRPLGNKLAERRPHYASFAHHVDGDTAVLLPRHLQGKVVPPVSKSHLHRLLIALFLSGSKVDDLPAKGDEGADIEATLRCLRALERKESVLDCGESGSTLRFFAPLAAALGVKAEFIRRGRLAERPMMEYPEISPGIHELRGDISSQFVTGLLFALPLLKGDSEIRFTTPLQSRGYVDMTLDVISRFGIEVAETQAGFKVPGGQKYSAPAEPILPERDWSGAAFWHAANALGARIEIEGLSMASRQPDKAVCALIDAICNNGEVDVSGCPDNYPALAVVDHVLDSHTLFTGTERLRLKESDRLEAMKEVFASPNDVNPRGDHRIAMAAAILAMTADCPTVIHSASCVRKSYPAFWDELERLGRGGK